jgi:hypothetical protein
MKNYFSLSSAILWCFTLQSQKIDTVVIRFFTDSNIQQYKGAEWHHAKVKIPSGKYSKAYLKIDLGCASYGCCAWDYTYQGYLSSSKDSSVKARIEVARLITPYSSFMRRSKQGYDSLWSHPYVYDVSDYMDLLKDSVFYSALTGGWDDKGKFGFKHTVSLILVRGQNLTPSSRKLNFLNGHYRYSDSLQFDSLIPTTKFIVTKNDKNVKFRMIFTGHDQQGEFSPIRCYLRINGDEIFSKRLWKEDCDRNAIQPQSGTWIFSRCNWCPGEKVEEIEFDVTPYLKEGENDVDFCLGKIETTDSIIQANYSIYSDLIFYESKPLYNAELVDIVSPNQDSRYRIENPTTDGVKIKVKNVGTHPIKNLHFEYFTSLGGFRKYSWAGRIPVDQDTVLRLPMIWNSADFASNWIFVRMIRSTQNRENDIDEKKVYFKSQKAFPSQNLLIELETTNDSTTNDLAIYDTSNKLVFTKKYVNNKSKYIDNITLPKGNYRLELKDYDAKFQCGDGLGFWYSSRVYNKTTGAFRIVDADTKKILKVFNPDFGGLLRYSFRLD